MATLTERIFRATPSPFKDALCSLYGWRLHRSRYGRRERDAFLDELRREEFLNVQDAARLSIERLRATLVRVCAEVPYYRELFANLKIDPAHLPLPEGLEQIPILEKATIRERPKDFISEAVNRQSLETRETSGTTGSPMPVRVDKASLRRNYAYYNLFRARAGTAVGRRRATFNGRVICSAARRRPPFWVRDWTENNLLFSVYHISPATADAYLERLRRFAPQEIHAYPSALLTLARHARAGGQALPHPECLIVSAESLGADDRAFLSEAFACPVFNQYGNAEMTLFAGDCTEGRLHVETGYSFVEIPGALPDAQGRLTGDIVTTGFVNRAMPLIRYRMGDTVTLTSDPCPCGRVTPVLQEVAGRTDDLLILPDGRQIGRMDPVFKGLIGLDEVQIIQESIQRVRLDVVPAAGYGPRSEKELHRAVADRLGAGVEIIIRQVENIPRTAGGKFRAVIRLFTPPDPPAGLPPL
ncbi:MAG: phenylacetate--CoA ligase family protein [Acidobacteria bacterium]|nr:MAG: phenylacetate--CoA ligase family protein [Acidobacteriota bacterium]